MTVCIGDRVWWVIGRGQAIEARIVETSPERVKVRVEKSTTVRWVPLSKLKKECPR